MQSPPDPDADQDSGPASGYLPRRQAGSSPQGLAMTLLADYGLRTRVWLPSGAIVALLAEFGISPGSARAAISRLTRRGTFESSRQGRHTAYRLTPSAATALAFGGRAIAGFPAEAEAWDGQWTVIAFSLPQQAGDVQRRALRNRLRWLGYAPLYDAFWVSPLPPSDGAVGTLADISLGAISVFRASSLDLGGSVRRDPLDAWDLGAVHRRYAAFIQQWNPLLPRLRTGDVAGAEALRTRTEVMDVYRRFLALDPRVPMRTMPPGWPRHEAREVFASVYDGLAGAGLDHVVATAGHFAEGPLADISAHTVGDLLAGISSPAGDASPAEAAGR